MMQLIELFQAQALQITFASIASTSEFMFDIEHISVRKVSIQLNSKPLMILFET
jgi:hypothetical protein